MAEKIVVTAVGIISALGYGVDAQLEALKRQMGGLSHPAYLKSNHKNTFLAGQVRCSDKKLAEMLGMSQVFKMGRTTLLAMLAVKDLLKDADRGPFMEEPLALVDANTTGGMPMYENKYQELTLPNGSNKNRAYVPMIDCANSTHQISVGFGLKPLVATISTACSSSANAIIFGARLIKQGIAKRAICGGCDPLSRFTLNGFNSLKNLEKDQCKPFDQNRNGLNLGEGSGYLLLESETAAKERSAPVLAYLSGYCNSNDAFHPTAPSPEGEGAYRTMKQAIDMANLVPGDIDYINAHGTATLNNDLAEGRAIERLFTDKIPYFSSTKPFTGHTLAAAGAIEAIFSIIALQQQLIPPNLNFKTPMEELHISPTSTLMEDVPVGHVLSNSFGFGGNNVSLVFSHA